MNTDIDTHNYPTSSATKRHIKHSNRQSYGSTSITGAHKFSKHLLNHLKLLNATQRHKASLILRAHKYLAPLYQIKWSPRIWAPLLYNRQFFVAS